MNDFFGHAIHEGDGIVYAVHGKYSTSAPELTVTTVYRMTKQFVIGDNGKKIWPATTIVLRRQVSEDKTKIARLEKEIEVMRNVVKNASDAKCAALLELKLLGAEYEKLLQTANQSDTIKGEENVQRIETCMDAEDVQPEENG